MSLTKLKNIVMGNNNDKKGTEFLETINSFLKYMIKEYGGPKGGRTLLVIASDDNKPRVSFIGNRIDGSISISYAMMSNKEIDEILSVSAKSVRKIKEIKDDTLKDIMNTLDKKVDDFLNGLTKGGKNE
jgi:hypothetical protein